jgi:hypothetical protein
MPRTRVYVCMCVHYLARCNLIHGVAARKLHLSAMVSLTVVLFKSCCNASKARVGHVIDAISQHDCVLHRIYRSYHHFKKKKKKKKLNKSL